MHGSILGFIGYPTPYLDVADDGLAALVDGRVLNDDLSSPFDR
jgi:hypothetical protein